MAWTSSAGRRGSFVPVMTLAGDTVRAAIENVPSTLLALSPLRLGLAVHIAAVLIAVNVLPAGALAVALSTTSLLVALIAIHAEASAYSIAGHSRRATAISEDRKTSTDPDNVRIADGCTLGHRAASCIEEPFSLAVERQTQRALQAAATPSLALAPQRNDDSQAWAALMARISHEIRTPLNAVIGFSDLMQAELFGPLGHARYGEYVDHIRDSGRALLKSAEDTLAMTSLLAMSKGEQTQGGASLIAVAKDAWAFLDTDAAEKDLSLDLDTTVGIDLLIDRRALRQILLNLFAEAIVRARPGSTIALIARADADLAQIELLVPETMGVATKAECTLGLSIARALLELSGSSLIELSRLHGGWQIATVLDREVQADFFAGRSGCASRPY